MYPHVNSLLGVGSLIVKQENAPESLHTPNKPLSHGRLGSGVPQFYKDLLSQLIYDLSDPSGIN